MALVQTSPKTIFFISSLAFNERAWFQNISFEVKENIGVEGSIGVKRSIGVEGSTGVKYSIGVECRRLDIKTPGRTRGDLCVAVKGSIRVKESIGVEGISVLEGSIAVKGSMGVKKNIGVK